MFGYVKIHKDELKVKEYNLFKAYYCGLCFELKECFGNIPRMTLSYDAAFLALLLSSLQDEPLKLCSKKCISNPFKRHPVVLPSSVMEYAAAINVILVHYKIKDDLLDNFSLKAIALTPLMLKSVCKVKKLYAPLFESAGAKLSALSQLEKQCCGNIDEVSDIFAQLLGELFSSCKGFDNDTKRILYKMGYSIGRFIYILDTYDDLNDDIKKKSYNPLIYCSNPPEKEELRQSLLFTLSDISLSYELLDIKKNKSILDNIIYMGLMDSLDNVFLKENK